MTSTLRALSLILFLFLVLPVQAQNEDAVVPDLSGLAVPVAAATLNQAGFRLGTQTSEAWTQASGLPQNSVAGQSTAAGIAAAWGTSINVTVLRSPNIGLIYDDNDLTVINRLDEPIGVSGLTFDGTEGTTASLAASRWTDTLRGQQCLQVWSVDRNGPKDVEGCRYIQTWFSTDNTAEHFWTQTSGAQRFSVLENGIERASCPAAAPNSQNSPTTCEFYLAGSGASADVTPFVYFAYTPDVIALINTSDDRWMPTDTNKIYNFNPNIAVPGASLRFGDPGLYGNPDIVADITQLAPGQCLVMTSDNPSGQPPETCNVIARLDLVPSAAFWLADFEIGDAAETTRHQCPAAVAGRLTLCIMPR